ncbi:glycosyltransferase [Candidatus Uhrbacteria bacterium]|nr:glycosyltransferase [Candidatus Uhrbacteria bacterium]
MTGDARRIRFLSLDLPPRRGGAARYHGAVIRALAPHVEVIPPRRHWLALLPSTIRAARTGAFDALLVSDLLPLGTVAWLTHVATGIPYTVICHGLDLQYALRVPRKRWIARHVLHYAERIIVNSHATAAIATRAGAPADRISIIAPSVSIPSNAPRDTPHQHPTILSVGRLIARKGFDTLIAAMAMVRERIPTAMLTIIGDGPEHTAIVAHARACGVPLTLLTNADDDALASSYAACDVFALLPRELPNGDIEGFGIVYLEAAAHGKPVVGTWSGGVPEAVTDGATSVLVPPNDPAAAARAITELLADPARARTLGAQGKVRIETEFTPPVFDARIRAAMGIMESSPHISIVIPIYGSPEPLTACLTALAAQTHQNFDITIVDDGSDPPIQLPAPNPQLPTHLIRQPHAGAPAARNRGARETNGELLLFLDADIVLAPTALECMVRALTAAPSASYAYGGFRFGWKHFAPLPFSADRLRRMPYIHTSALLWRAHFPRFDESLKRFQDWDLWLTMLAAGHTGVSIPDTLFHVRQMRGTMSRWVPSFAYRLPWRSARVRAYEHAAAIIRAKHHLPS